MSFDLQQTELILGNSNPRFSGVTSTMLQVLRYQKDMINVVVLGSHHLPDGIPQVSFGQLIKLCRKPLQRRPLPSLSRPAQQRGHPGAYPEEMLRRQNPHRLHLHRPAATQLDHPLPDPPIGCHHQHLQRRRILY